MLPFSSAAGQLLVVISHRVRHFSIKFMILSMSAFSACRMEGWSWSVVCVGFIDMVLVLMASVDCSSSDLLERERCSDIAGDLSLCSSSILTSMVSY